MGLGYRALVVDDDSNIRKLIRVNLESRGYRIQEAPDGETALSLFKRDQSDFVLLDLIMPGINGIEVCKRIRDYSDVPIVVLSAHDQENLKIEALDSGADDYLTKPFSYEELMARIRAVMRRVADQQSEEKVLDFGGLIIDQKLRRVFVNDQDVHLTRTEFALLSTLAESPGAILTHQELLTRVWGSEYFDANHYLHVYFGRIRSKIGAGHSDLLETVPGVGYSLHLPHG